MIRLTILFLIAATLANAQPVTEQQKKGTVIRYYPGTKQVHYSGAVHKHLREATWVFYSQAGERIKTEEYRGGLLHGKTEVYFRDKKIATEQYADNLLQGPQKYFDKAGQLMQIQYFTAGVADSIYNYNYEGKMVLEKIYLRNERQYRYARYHTNGSLAETGSRDEAGLKTGTWLLYHPAQEAADTIPDEIIRFVSGKRNGICVKRDYMTQTTSSYVNDTLHGSYERTGLSGYRNTGTYKNGKLDGVEQTFKSGVLVEKNFWTPDGRTGVTKYYYDSGELRANAYFGVGEDLNGLPDSIHWFYPTGKRLAREIHRNPGNGITREKISWHENGQPAKVEFYRNGIEDSTWKTFAINGKLLQLFRYKNGHFDGLQQVWWENGRKKIEVIFRNGQQQHPVKAWKTDGTPADLRSTEVAAWNEWTFMDVQLLPASAKNENGLVGNSEMNELHTSGDADIPELTVVNGDPDPPVLAEINENTRISWAESNPKPEFPGGEEALQQFIRDNLHYPAAEKARGVKCTVQLTFIVNYEGVLENVYAFRKPSRSPAFGVEAERIASTMPRWKPGMKNGKKCAVAMTLDIPFTLPAP